jgi:hypothetical protein
METLLKKEDQSLQSIAYKIGKQEVQQKDQNLIDAIINNNLKIEVNREIVPAEIDLNGLVAYDNDTDYDQILASEEVPINDSLLITSFMKIYHEMLEKKYPGKNSYDPNQMKEALEAAINNFRTKNDREVQKLQSTIDVLYAEQSKEIGEYQNLLQEAKSRSSRLIKLAIFITIVQWAVLLYLTYYVVGWDVTEPIGYLIALAIETAGLIFYIRYARNLEQRAIFNMIFRNQKRNILRAKSLNPEAEIAFINRRAKYLTQRILYSRST